MQTITRLLIALCVALILTSNLYAMSGNPPQKKGSPAGNALGAEQIRQLFSDQTAVATFKNKDKIEVYYYSPDGQVTEVGDDFLKYGSWYVREDGRLCVKIEDEHKGFRMIIKDGEQYHQYAVKEDGKHDYEQTYSRFTAGNRLKTVSQTTFAGNQ